MKSWMIVAMALAAPVSAQQIDPDRTVVEQIPTCVNAVRDQVTGNCVGVSSTPTTGTLLPLGPALGFNTFGDLQTDRHFVAEGGLSSLSGLSASGVVYGVNGLQTNGRVQMFGSGGAYAFLGLAGLDEDLSFDFPLGSAADWEFWQRGSGSDDRKAYITNLGNMALDGNLFTGGADVAEYYPLQGSVEPGDVVSFTGDGITIARAVAGARARLAGVVSTDPGVVLGLTYTDESETGENPEDLVAGNRLAAIHHEIQVNRRAPLALTGRVPCKVTGENGPIRAGDLLTVSSVPGHAMKATDSGAVVGTALEDWRAGEGTILVLANLGWFSPTAELERGMSELQAEVEQLSRRLEELASR